MEYRRFFQKLLKKIKEENKKSPCIESMPIFLQSFAIVRRTSRNFPLLEFKSSANEEIQEETALMSMACIMNLWAAFLWLLS